MHWKAVPRSALAALLVMATMEMPPAQAQRTIEPSKTKSGETLKSVFRTVTADVNKSTVVIRTDDKGTPRQVALGTVITADGYILTKGSEIVAQPRVYVTLSSRNGLMKNFNAKVVGFSEDQDLAMLKIDATGLVPVTLPIRAPRFRTHRAGAVEGVGGGAAASDGAVEVRW